MNPRLAHLILCLLVLLTGCADLSPLFRKAPVAGGPTPPPSASPAAVSAPIPFHARALEYEKNGDLQLALFFWRVASRLNPQDKEVTGRIESLRITIERESQKHFEKGVVLFGEGRRKEAQTEFLIALHQNPDHQDALDYLKNRIHAERYISHVVAAGDTFPAIAEKLYRDPQMGLLITTLLGVAPTAKPTPGTVLRLPKISEKLTPPTVNIDQELENASRLLADGQYEAAAALMDKVLQQEPANSAARSLADQAHYQNGKRLHLEQRYRDALRAFKKASPGYQDSDAFVAVIRQQLEKDAETHYRKGVTYFVNEDLAKAIEEWEQTLALNPEHQKAAQDIENARELLKKLKKVEQPPAN
jgi:tetratricopeptide (TPR) repeat protein